MEGTGRRSDPRRLSRRALLALTGSSAAALLLASCGTPAAPPPPTAVPKPAAAPPPQPTAAPAQAAAAAPAAAKAAEPAIGPAEKSKIVFSTFNANYANQATLFSAVDKGFFKEEGLEIQIVDTEQGLEGAVGGSVDIAHLDTGPSVAAMMKDVKAKMVSPWRTSEFFMYSVSKKINTVADMDGKSMINYPIGDRVFLLHLGFLKEAGYDTSTVKVNWIQMPGTSDAKVQTFLDGKVDGAYHYPRHLEDIKTAGGRNLYQKLQKWPQEMLLATDAFIAKNPNTITRFLRAIIRGAQIWTDTKNKDYIIKLMESKGFKIPDPYKRAYEFEPIQFSPDMGFDPADMQKLLVTYMPNPPSLSSFFDPRFLNAAQRSLGLKPNPAL